MTEEGFRALLQQLDRSHHWPDGRGALALLGPHTTAAALATVTEGVVLSCAERPGGRALDATLATRTEQAGSWLAVNERLELEQHGPQAHTHLDALGHFFYAGAGFGGTGTADVTPTGVTAGDVTAAAGGVVGRGLLLDLPRLLGVPYVPADRRVHLAEVLDRLDRVGASPAPGDLLFVRTGRPAAPVPAPGELAGVGSLDLDCARWVHDQEFAVVVTDNGLDSPTPQVDGVPTPWHVLTLVALGVHLVDLADLEELSAACDRLGRATFAAVLAALPLAGATASPVNPLAVL